MSFERLSCQIILSNQADETFLKIDLSELRFLKLWRQVSCLSTVKT